MSIVKLKQLHEIHHLTLRRKQVVEGEPEATEEELLATLESEDDD